MPKPAAGLSIRRKYAIIEAMRFSKTISHEKQKQLFEKLAQNQTLGHAYAFVGPEHVGKTTFALELAIELGADQIFDIVFYDKEEGITISEAREVQGRLSLTPVGKIKVAILTHAERMSMEAANSLLKTLEEPVDKSLLILTTANFHGLLPTITSRLQRVNFGLAQEQETRQAVGEFELDKKILSQILALASGKIGLAKKMAADPESLNFCSEAQRIYAVLLDGNIQDRLKVASTLFTREVEDVKRILQFAMDCWIQDPKQGSLGRKLLAAYKDLQYNLNMRLILDNLFLI
ncbi:MAG: hypothetical protein Q8R08_05025 [bacterium]|nr:hypothetical protein [bacterium]